MATKKKKTTRKKPRVNSEQIQAKRQLRALILLAVAILTFCLALFEGENVWTWLHEILLGLFSYSAYILPVLLGAAAIVLAFDKDKASMATRIWQSATIAVLLNSTIYAFAVDTGKHSFWSAIGECYVDGVDHSGGGVLGVLIGWPFEYMFGDLGAKIIFILLLAVFLMLVTGTTVVSVIRAMRKPVEKTKETLETAITHTAERFGRARKTNIDIDMGEGYAGKRRSRKRKPETTPEIELPFDEEPTADATEDKLAAMKQAGAALHEEPVRSDAESEDDEPMMTQEQAEKELQEDLKDATDVQETIYRYPPLTLLDGGSASDNVRMQEGDRAAVGNLLVNTLKDFGISTELGDITCGPSVTRYELVPSAGVKISRITGLSDDIALRLATTGVRIEAPIPNKAAVGIEVPNKARRTVRLRSLLDTAEYRTAKGRLTVALGQDIEGRTVLTDLAKMPHLLIAGTTGSGKSVCTNSMIQSVLFRSRPDEVKMILIDPKKVEFGVYNGIPHLLIPVVTDPRKASAALSWAVNEMLKRYQMFAESKARDISDYNDLARKEGKFPPLPLILIVIDELADLMMAAGNEVEDSICRLAQMARAAGMHMVIATQRPSVDVITGLIKGNIPSRLALTVASGVDSRTILDSIGAEKLLGNGDMLFMPLGQSKPLRVQGCYVTNQEVERVVDFLKDGDKAQEYDQQVIEEIEKQAAAGGKNAARDDGEDGDDTDEALPQAIEIAVEAGSISTSMLQRKMRFGYARAGRIIDQMEQRGIVGPSEGSKPRKVLITRQQWIEMNMNNETE